MSEEEKDTAQVQKHKNLSENEAYALILRALFGFNARQAIDILNNAQHTVLGQVIVEPSVELEEFVDRYGGKYLNDENLKRNA